MSHKIYKLKNGQEVPSVTTIIGNVLGFNKNILIQWSKSLAFKGINSDKIKDESALIGTSTHYLIETKILNEKINKDKLKHLSKEQLIQVTNAYKSWKKWEEEWCPEQFVHSELELVSEEYEFAGTVDIICKKNNELYILDNKTSNSLHMEMIIQLGAYKLLYEENYPEKINHCGIIKIQKDKINYKLNIISNKAIKAGQKIFLNALEIYNLKDLVKF